MVESEFVRRIKNVMRISGIVFICMVILTFIVNSSLINFLTIVSGIFAAIGLCLYIFHYLSEGEEIDNKREQK